MNSPAESWGEGRDTLAAIEGFAGLGAWFWAPGARALLLSDHVARRWHNVGEGGHVPLRAVLRAIGPIQRRQAIAGVRAAIRHGEPTTLSLALTFPHGAVSLMEVCVRPGREGGLWGLCQDATRGALRSEALDQPESRWEIALETARQGVWDVDLETDTSYHSRTWRAMRGMMPDGDPRDDQEQWKARIHPDDFDYCMETSRRQLEGRVHRVVMEYRERHMDGHYMWISSVGAPVEWFPDGRPRRIVGTDTDITAHKRALDNLASLSRRLEVALDLTNIGVFELNLATGHYYWDNRALEMFRGLGIDPAVDTDQFINAVHPDDRPLAEAAVADAAARQSNYGFTFRVIAATGEVRTCTTRGTYHEDSDGTATIIAAVWDVTEDLQAKQDLERAKSLAEARNGELEQAKARIEYNALHDTLTGLPNRRYLDQWLSAQTLRCAAEGAALAVLHIDLDRFKQINDTLGHAAGDAILVHVAGLLRARAGEGDMVAHVGGDEFALVCQLPPHADEDVLRRRAALIVDEMRHPVAYGNHSCRFGASIGIALQRGETVDARQLLIEADIALSMAKRRGRNGYEFFSTALQAETVNTKRLADDIMRGIEHNEFIPYYQPLFCARTGALAGAEALARWLHPIAGLLSPAAFLKVAEDFDAASAIDRGILEHVLADMEGWDARGLVVPSVSVNLTFRRLQDEQLISGLRTLDIQPGRLAFELLESIFLDETDSLVNWGLDQIRELGIALDIDDFGTGHASILGLLRLRPRRLKIDRQFIETIESSESQRRLVASLIEIGHTLSISVVAEGVETLEQARILRDLDCDLLQGYALARPMSPAAFRTALDGKRWREAC